VSSAGTNKKNQEKKEKENNPQIKAETVFYGYGDDEGLYDKLEKIIFESRQLYDNLLSKTIERSNLVGN
jgi:hypothetical protein